MDEDDNTYNPKRPPKWGMTIEELLHEIVGDPVREKDAIALIKMLPEKSKEKYRGIWAEIKKKRSTR